MRKLHLTSEWPMPSACFIRSTLIGVQFFGQVDLAWLPGLRHIAAQTSTSSGLVSDEV